MIAVGSHNRLLEEAVTAITPAERSAEGLITKHVHQIHWIHSIVQDSIAEN